MLKSINALDALNAVSFKKQDSKITNPQFRAEESNSLEKSPAQDEYKKEGMSTGAKAAIGVLGALALFAAGDAIFNHGKMLKKIFGKAKEEVAAAAGDSTGAEAKNNVVQAIEHTEPKLLPLSEESKAKVEEAAKKAELLKKKDEILKAEEYTFTHSGNVFTVNKGKIVSYKNSAAENAEELINKYNNPVDEMDKVYKNVIDDLLKNFKNYSLELEQYPEVARESVAEIIKGIKEFIQSVKIIKK